MSVDPSGRLLLRRETKVESTARIGGLLLIAPLWLVQGGSLVLAIVAGLLGLSLGLAPAIIDRRRLPSAPEADPHGLVPRSRLPLWLPPVLAFALLGLLLLTSRDTQLGGEGGIGLAFASALIVVQPFMAWAELRFRALERRKQNTSDTTSTTETA